ncbi:MAG TPA: hypothetical protein VH186_08580 [Chloroflexia bacterium]|nr:hypothetical protein [Chloroflexia bacterium]
MSLNLHAPIMKVAYESYKTTGLNQVLVEDILERTGLEDSLLEEQLNSLENQGYIRLSHFYSDGTAAVFEITPKGIYTFSRPAS